MPADPNIDFKDIFSELKEKLDGFQGQTSWYDYVDHSVCSNEEDYINAVFTGFFYKASFEKKKIFMISSSVGCHITIKDIEHVCGNCIIDSLSEKVFCSDDTVCKISFSKLGHLIKIFTTDERVIKAIKKMKNNV